MRLTCEKDVTLLAQFHEQHSDLETCLALNDVLAHEDIDGIVVATTTETHYTIAKEALLAGKHVFAEQPLVLVEEQAQELIAIAREKQRILMVGICCNTIRSLSISNILSRRVNLVELIIFTPIV